MAALPLKGMVNPDKLRSFGNQVDFGRTAEDYAAYRAGFPPAFFELLVSRQFAREGETALDLGCGTGTLARGLARLGLSVTGLDPAESLLEQARAFDMQAGLSLDYRVGQAENTGLPDAHFDLVTAGQCWHWFDRTRAVNEIMRLLASGGRIIIAHFDWLPLQGNVVAATEELILSFNPEWAGAGGNGIYPDWLSDLGEAGFSKLETHSFDVSQPYNHAGWRGRIRASAGVAASLSEEETSRFDAELAALLKRDFANETLEIPHRVWFATGCKT
ncbi:MAG: class I SAM-dependent methyltransferase [Pseudomonadota bacterium]